MRINRNQEYIRTEQVFSRNEYIFTKGKPSKIGENNNNNNRR